MKILNLLFVLMIFLALFSCEKAINIKLDPIDQKLVVEASIENNQTPLVVLSKNLEYFANITPEIISSSYVKNAIVTVSDGIMKQSLSLDSVKLDSSDLFKYYYTDQTGLFLGKEKGQYSLEIELDGKYYTATTSIPEITRQVDSLWWQPLQLEKASDTPLIKVIIKAKDKPGLGDYIRYFTKVNHEPFYPGLNSVYDDQIIDGITYIIPVDRGVDKNATLKEDNLYYHLGDTVTVKISNIDRVTYDFWRTYEFNFQSLGNPFSSPVKILGNISNGAFGYFGGYASQYKTIIIK